MKFVGVSLAYPSGNPQMFEYFLEPKHHRPGIPLDMISYHFYATPAPDETLETQQHTFFDQADRFIATVRYIEEIRKRLSPGTRTAVNEIGSISPDDMHQKEKGYVMQPIAPEYWRLSGAMFAYVFGNLATLGIDVMGESQLVGYPTQFPSVSMLDWNTGAPNARFRVLELLKDNFAPGYRIVEVNSHSPYVYAFAVVTSSGARKILLVNKRSRPFQFTFPQALKTVQSVDEITGDAPHSNRKVTGNQISLGPLATTVVTLQP
jgi:hypothetical protein